MDGHCILFMLNYDDVLYIFNYYRAHYDAVFELVSVLQNAAFWYVKHASKVAAQDE